MAEVDFTDDNRLIDRYHVGVFSEDLRLYAMFKD